jgi:uncharacterized protein
VGQGDGDSEVGDVVAKGPGDDQAGQGKQAGDQPGTDFYEAEVTVDDLAELIFADLGLPDLRPKATQEVPTDTVKFTEVRKKGPMGNLDKKRTIMENLKRNAMKGLPEFGKITNEDLRFKVWEQETRPSSSAVVVAMRDASGSMGEFKKYITRSLFFWMVRFLRTKYQDVEIVLHRTKPQGGPHMMCSPPFLIRNYAFSLGSRVSRSQSPTRFSPSTEICSASPGNTATHQWVVM